MRQITKQEEKRFLKSMHGLRESLINLAKKIPRIIEKRKEAEKNRKPRDPLSDAW